MLTPPVKTSVPQPLLPLQSSTPLHSAASSLTSTLPAEAPALRTTPVYTQSNQYPNMYPAPLQVDPYQQYQPSPYHQPSPQGSYHSPQGYHAGVSPHALTSPHHQMVSPHANPMGSPHHPMGSPHHPMTSPHHNPMTSPHHGNPMTSPHHMTSPHYVTNSPHHSATPMLSPQYSASYGQQQPYPGSPVQYGGTSYPPPSQPAAPPVQHSPLTPSSSQYRNLGREPDRKKDKEEDRKERLSVPSHLQIKEESLSPTR